MNEGCRNILTPFLSQEKKVQLDKIQENVFFVHFLPRATLYQFFIARPVI